MMLMIGVTAALGQDKESQGPDATRAKIEAKHQALLKVLASIDATPAQVNRIVEIRERYVHEKLGLAAANDQVDLGRLHALQEEAGKALASVLSPSQFQKLRASGGIPAVLGEEPGRNPWDFLRKLDLTLDQRVQMKRILARANRSMDAVENDRSLSADQAKAKLGALHDTAISELESILNPAQQQQLHRLLYEQTRADSIKP